MTIRITALLLFFISIQATAQKLEYSILTLPDSLKQNANAIIRLNKVDIHISSQKSMTVNQYRVVTVLNELGLEDLNLVAHYDKNTRVSGIEATAYDSFGKEIKAYKRKDFKDVSVADGVSIFNDNRALYLDYTPVGYPFTMIFECKTETANTAFIQPWVPLEGYLISTQNSEFTITYKPELHLRYKEVNFSNGITLNKNEIAGKISYTAKNLAAKKKEDLSPDFYDVFPIVYFTLDYFALESVEGKASSWEEFGKWYYDSLLSGTDELPESTQQKIKELVGTEKNPIEIAKKVYHFVQQKTRYVSVQVGIGGWKPMLAKDVDKLGYGDCKALTNYTRALLKTVGVPSYYTVVYAGDREMRDLQSDFSSLQGNHAILTLPTDNGLVWLECTSQVQPFGFQGDFTDDRNVLLIKPEGGEIVKTKTFTEKENLKTTTAQYQVTENGHLSGKVKMVSNGLQYDWSFHKERKSREDQIKDYKEEFSNINNLKINKIAFHNNVQQIEFTEELEMEAESYAQNSAGKLLFALNAFDQNAFVPKKYKNREFPFAIDRGYTDMSQTEITLPEGYVVEAKPEGIMLDNEFGYYKIEFIPEGNSKIVCKRKMVLKKGFYDKSKYETYRKFRETIAKNDNSKIVITKP
ncbi:DUF3857 domain-containing protein [Flavobacterium sp.]|uniref:DUF3857 domain-containing protein n=1 Tax=Flavobacterium sp. TaxID=239 RepID=UPI002FDEDA1E